MRTHRVVLLVSVAIALACQMAVAQPPEIVAEVYPGFEGAQIVCWTSFQPAPGFLSRIEITHVGSSGRPQVLWQSSLESAYAPRISFVDEIRSDGLPIALVERQHGAAASQLDVIGRKKGRFDCLCRIEGFKFDVVHLDSTKEPFVIAHEGGNVLDVPIVYRWTGQTLADDSKLHPGFYDKCFTEAEKELPANPSGVVCANLSKLALLAGKREEARGILERALKREQDKGSGADQETLRLVRGALRDVEQKRR